jgi:hypothetical protein
MIRNRPSAVMVIAIFNFIIGGFSLLSVFCGGFFLFIAAGGIKIPMPPGQESPLDMITDMYKSIPGFFVYSTVSMVLSAIAGLLAMVVGLVYTIAIMNPAMAAWQADWAAKHNLPRQQGEMNQVSSLVGGWEA